MDRIPEDTGRMLERGAQLAAVGELLGAADAGRGGLVLIEGPAGIGKSTLMEACAEDAERRGMTALRVSGDQLVMESSFAAVRELFWPAVTAGGPDVVDGAARLALPVFQEASAGGSDRDRASSVLHGLYWLTSDLADRGTVALLVDDGQWLDAASQRFLLYLARRIESLPVALLVALRTGAGFGAEPVAVELAELATAVLRLAPLTEDASTRLIRDVLGPRADEELCHTCYEATRGNPFYLRELAAALRAQGGRPTVALAERVRAQGIAAIAGSVVLRLSRLGEDCERLAQALVVLGPDSSLRHAASLAGLDRERAAAAADELHRADLLSGGPGLTFAHPIVSDAVSWQLPPARRASLHAAAAELLASDGASADLVAAHLLSAEPYGEAWVVQALRGAADKALAQGAPEAAVSYLRRARREPPAAEVRLDVMLELGRAEALLPRSHDFVTLGEAFELASDPEQRAEIAFEHALALYGVLRSVDGRMVIESVLDADTTGLSEHSVNRLEQALIGGGIDDLAAAPRLRARAQRHLEKARSGGPTDPRMLATLSIVAVVSGEDGDEAATLAMRALADGRLLTEWLNDGYVTAGCALTWSDRLAEAATMLDAGLDEAQRRGSAPMYLQMTWMRAEAALRAGDLGLAEDYAQRAFDMGRDLGVEHAPVMWLPIVLVERGRVDEALPMFDSVRSDEETLGMSFGVIVLANRGRTRVAAGDHERGLADLRDAHRRMADGGWSLSTLVDWVPAAVSALGRLGRAGEADELTARELDGAATSGAPRRHGLALATRGAFIGGEAGAAALGDAVEILDRCGARLEQARALVDLGVALRESGRRDAARQSLALGLDAAHRCGGWALAERARAQLVAGGARPRRSVLRGPDALTAAETRVARMAAGGLSNRQIAQALFVSAKTVEGQLSQAYAKLGIRSRAGLAAALSKGERGEQAS
jgi:DNA-binding CsgD family transcriptional regulator